MKYQVIIIGGGPAGYTAGGAAGEGGLSGSPDNLRWSGGISACRSCR